MYKICSIFTILFLTMYSSSCFANWTFVTNNSSGDQYYLNFDELRKQDNYIYFWRMTNYLEPNKYGDLSSKYYFKADCDSFRQMNLSASFHKEPMGKGSGDIVNPAKHKEYSGWKFPSIDTVSHFLLKKICNH